MLKINLELKLIIFIVAIASVPLLILDLLWFSNTSNEALKTASSEIVQLNQQASHELSTFFNKQIQGLDTQAYIDDPENDVLPITMAELTVFMNLHPEVQMAQISDNENKILLRTPGSTKQKEKLSGDSVTAQIKASIEKKYPLLSDIFENEDKVQSVILVYPISSQRVVVEEIRLSLLLQSLSGLKTAHGGFVHIVNEKGIVVADTNNDDTSGEDMISEESLSDFKNTMDSSKTYQTTDIRNHDVLINYSTESFTGWGVISEIPTANTLSNIRNLELFTILLFLFTLIFVGAVGSIITGNIVKPIKKLENESKKLAAGQFGEKISIKSGDEIEELADSFNFMSQKLKDSFDKLNTSKELISAERNKLSVILAGINDAVIAVDRQRHIITFNPAAEKLTGCKQIEVNGRHISEVFELFDKTIKISPDQYCPIRNDEFEGVTYSANDLKLSGANNKESIINIASGHISEGIAVGVGCIISMQDVTEKHNLETMKMDFVSMAAHELRTPLTAIKGYLALLDNELKDCMKPDQKDSLNHINRAVEILSGHVEGLLNVTRIERGVLVIMPMKTDWIELIKSTISDLSTRTQAKNMNIIFEPEDKTMMVTVDGLRMREVVTNLISNALNYTREGGTITVSIEKKSSTFATHVSDTGIGIPAESVPHLFSKFYRVSNELSVNSQGTGLGLYICKSIVELHGGTISVISKVNEGSTFSFTLPIDSPVFSKKT